MAWDQTFFDPIVLPSGKKLVTLRDAAEYITELPRAEHDGDEWQAAMEALLLVAENDGPPMFARIGRDAGATQPEAGYWWPCHRARLDLFRKDT